MSRRPPAPARARPSGATAGPRRTAGPGRGAAGAPAAVRPVHDRGAVGPRPAPPPRTLPPEEREEAATVRLARLLSVRALVLAVVGLVAFTLLFPSVRAYLGQQAELDRLAVEVTAAEQREQQLAEELERWQEPEYVQAQARSRLSYVLPGETPYRVIDPEVVVEQPAVDGTTTPATGPALPAGGSGTPWYATIWTSIGVAGEVDVPDEGQR